MDKIQENKIKEMYNLRRPLKGISKEVGLPTKKIKDFLQQEKLGTGHKYMLYYFDEFYFDKINTEEKAYWLGFIYADGYIGKNKGTVGIELKSTDSDHLEKFRNTLHAENTVKFYKKNSTFGPQEVARFQIYSQHMGKIMYNYYGAVHKTFQGHFPRLENIKLIPHLIRGFFDGDGSLHGANFTSDIYIAKPQISFIGTQDTLRYIETISGFQGNGSQRYPERNLDNGNISCGRVNDTLSFLHFMYDNASIYLDRKYLLFQQLLENRKLLSAKARV